MHRFTIDRVLTDKRLLGAELGDGESWQTWRIAFKGAFGLALTDAEREVFDAICRWSQPTGTAGARTLVHMRPQRWQDPRWPQPCPSTLHCFVKHKLSGGERAWCW